eukprot:6652616-Heterocapsa_arctica.AAC.1
MRLAPDHARDPCPVAAMFLFCDWCDHHRGRMGANAAAAALISFDCFLRKDSALILERRLAPPPMPAVPAVGVCIGRAGRDSSYGVWPL